MKRVGNSFIRNLARVLVFAAAVLLFGPRQLFSQSVVNFANDGQFTTIADRRVYDPTTCAPLVGSNWVAALYFGFTPDTITELAVRNFEDFSLLSAIARFHEVDPSNATAGTWHNAPRLLLGTVIGQTLTMQVRVWDLSKFATFEDARAMGGYALESTPFSYLVTNPHASDPFGTKLNNFMGITPPECVPEPSVFALVTFGIGVVLAWRRENENQNSGLSAG